MQQTVALIKPDAVYQGKVGAIISELEDRNIKIVYMRKLQFTEIQARLFYGKQHTGKPYFQDLVTFMTSGPIVAMVLEAENIIAVWRRLMGPINPDARQRGQIRFDYGGFGHGSMMENVVHGSDSQESYEHELASLSITPSVLLG